MRSFLCGLVLVAMAFTAGAADKTTPISIPTDGSPVLALTVPAKASAATKNGRTLVRARDLYLYVWVVAGASNVTEGVARVADVIKGEVVNFKPATTTDLTVGGAAAKMLVGPSAEADDGDEGNAEVVVFTVGGRVFIACIHGEGKLSPKEHAAMMATLQTAKAP